MKKKSVLDNIFLAAPCPYKWESMEGDDRVRKCSGCESNVYNISDMTRQEAERFIEENGESQCAIFFRRKDGTILTDDCPVGLRKIRDRLKLAVTLAAAAAAFLVALPQSLAQSKPLQGKNQKRKSILRSKLLNNKKNVHGGPPGRICAPLETLKNPGVETKTQNNQVKASDDKGIKTYSETRPLRKVDVTALNYYKAGQSQEKAGKLKLAESLYRKALDAFKLQKSGDPEFKKKLEADLQRVSKKRSTRATKSRTSR